MLKFIKFKDGEKYPDYAIDENGNKVLQESTSINAFESAGIKVPATVVVVDFDNHSNDTEIDKRLKDIIAYFDQKYPTFKVTSEHGYHLYYKIPKDIEIKNWSKVSTAYGIPVDYKTGTHITVKLNGKARETNKSFSELKFNSLPDLPEELYPLIKSKNLIFMNAGTGDRDNNMYNHLMNLKETYPSISLDSVANFINKYLFKEPLTDKEIKEKVANVGAKTFSDGNYHGDTKDMISFGEYIAKKLDMKIYNSTLYYKDGLNYSKDKIKMNKEINKYLKLRRSQMTELDAQLYIYADLVDNKQKFYVKLRNGVIVEDNVMNFDCGFTPFYLDVTYNPDAYDKNVDDFINFVCCDRLDMRLVLEEILGHILLVTKFPHKIFFLTGSGANGKSTFVEMITKFAGELSSHIDISSFDDGTSLTSLIGKIVNVADDVDAIYLEKSKNLKTMASGNTVGARAIYSQPITLKNTATLIFTANEPPVFKDKSDGIGRRLLIIPFENKVKERICNLDDLLSTDNAKSYILNLALAGVKRIYENNLEISDSETIAKATKQYYLDNDSVLAYLNDYPDINGNPISSVYESYEKYCEDSNLKAVSLNKFSRRIKSLGYEVEVKKILNKPIRVITKT